MALKSDPKFEDKRPCGLEMTWGISQIFTRALESVKTETLMGSFLSKVENSWAKIYRGHWRMIRNLERNWLVVSKLAWGIYEFWPKHSKVSKIFTFD